MVSTKVLCFAFVHLTRRAIALQLWICAAIRLQPTINKRLTWTCANWAPALPTQCARPGQQIS
jgi:hypothetical protein